MSFSVFLNKSSKVLFDKLKSFLPQTIREFILDPHERSINANRNIIALFLIKGCSIAISLLIIPLTLHYVSSIKYGIWLTLSSIIAWFGFFDIGFGNGLRNKFTEALANGEKKLARIYVSTTYAILTLIILLIVILFLIINPFLNWAKILNTESGMASELSTLAVIVFIFFCIQFVLQLITIVITSDQKPAKTALINLIGNFLSLIIIFILTKTTKGSLLYLGASLSFTPILVLLSASFWYYKREYKEFTPALKYVDFSYAKNLMSLGIKFFFISICAVIIFQTNNIIIAQLLGPQEVTSYNIANRYFGIILTLFSILMTPFWTAFTEAHSKSDYLWIRKTITKLQVIWLITIILTGIMLLFANFIYSFWIGKDVTIPFKLSLFAAVYVLLYNWQMIYLHFLNGLGKIQIQLFCLLFMSILNVPLALFLGKRFGIIGIMLSSILLFLFLGIILFVQYRKIINNKAFGIWAK